MAYTVHSMMAHAELHHQSAQTALHNATQSTDGDMFVGQCQKAAAEAQAGLLAIELAKYAAGTWSKDGAL